ncbi:MAG TPA: hypothetical protein VFE94_03270 [Candidatus Paceibacterota bacterium]|nr:hypothetical protein [Candidatus Paceibacterota bacterium]
MVILHFLQKYKVGAIGGLIYGTLGFMVLYGLGACRTSQGACVAFSPLVFHQTIVQLVAANLATPLFLIPLNAFVFIFEGAAIEMLTRKLK